MINGSLNLLLRHVRQMAACSGEDQVSDRLLLKRFVESREDGAFAELTRRHGPMVWGLCRGMLRNWHDAEDAFQAAFLVLARKAASIRRPEALAGWLHGVAYHLACKARAGAARRVGRISNPSYSIGEQRKEDMPANDPLLDMTCRELQRTVQEELARLPDKYRVPLVLCYLEGKRQEEAARELGCSPGALRGRLNRGRERLRQRLLKHGLTVSSALVAGVLTETANATVPVALTKATIHAGLLAAAGKSAAGAVAGRAAVLADGAIQAMVAGKVKFGLVLFMALGLAGLSLAAAAQVLTTDSAAVPPEARSEARAPSAHAEKAPPAQPPLDAAGRGREDLAADPLPGQGIARLGTARYRHGTRIECLAVSADGKLAVTASGNSPYNPALAGRFSPARVFDLTDGRCLYSLPNERGSYDEYPEAVSLSPEGKTLATRDGKFLYFWDAVTGKALRKVKFFPDSGGSRSPTDWLTFTPDGKQVAVTLMGTAVHLIDVETGKLNRTFDMPAAARACVFSADGKLMATGGYEQENGVYYARLWEVATGKELRRFPIAHQTNRPITTLAFSHDGTKLAGASWGDGQLRLFDVATGKELKVFPKIGEDIQGIAFAPDGKTVAAAGDRIHLYDPATGKERLQIERKARALTFTLDGAVLIGAVSGAIYRWDASSGRQLTPDSGQDSAPEQIMVSADGRQVFTTDQDGDLRIWDVARGKSPHRTEPRRIVGGIERGVVASWDRRFLAWTVRDVHGNSRIRLYDVTAKRVIEPALRSSEGFTVIGGEATVVAFLPDGKSLLTFEQRGRTRRAATGPSDSTAPGATFRLWDVESGKERRSFAAIPPEPVAMHSGAAPAKDSDVPVRLWNVATGKAGHKLDSPMNVLRVPNEAGSGTVSYLGFGPMPSCTTRRAALAPDGKTLALGPDWAAIFGNRRMKPMDGRAFSPDGRLLVDWAENPLGRSRMDHVYVWDAATGRAVATLDAGPRPGANCAAFAPDGRTLATASADGVVRLWETATWKVRAEFRGHRDRVTALAFGPDGRLFTGGLDTVVVAWDVRPPQGQGKGTLADAWDALATYDARAGFQAQGCFLGEPGRAVDWFAARLTRAVRPDPSRVKALIADLEKDDFATRARASAALKEQWPATEAALREAAAKPSSLEAGRRAESIIRNMEKAITPPGALRALRAAEVLEWIATKEARSFLLELAKGAPEAHLTRAAAAACRRLGEDR
jgi:RNA polymerase sigma factor (sigma-70 family)